MTEILNSSSKHIGWKFYHLFGDWNVWWKFCSHHLQGGEVIYCNCFPSNIQTIRLEMRWHLVKVSNVLKCLVGRKPIFHFLTSNILIDKCEINLIVSLLFELTVLCEKENEKKIYLFAIFSNSFISTPIDLQIQRRKLWEFISIFFCKKG